MSRRPLKRPDETARPHDPAASGQLLYAVNETYFFLSHRLAVAQAAARLGYQVAVAAPSDHVWAPAGFDVGELLTHGFDYHEIPLSRRGQNPLREMATLYAFYRLLRRLRPDVLHLLTVKPVLYGGLAARWASVPAVVATVTGLGHIFVDGDARSRLLRQATILAYRRVAAHPNVRFIFQNSDDRDALLNSGALRSAQCRLIHGSGVALDRFRPTPEQHGIPMVLLASRLIWEKGIAEFVAAAQRLREAGMVAHFVIAGDTQPSNPRSVPRSRLAEWQEAGLIEWWGRREDMPQLMAQAHIICLPSRYGEGVPKVLLEAAASGRPTVATDIAGCRQAVLDGITGRLVPPGDVAALAEALSGLLSDAQLRRRMGAAARALAEREFDEQSVAEATLAVYRELRDRTSQANCRR